MRTVIAVALLGMALVPLTALADPGDDATACKPDVFRLCSSAIPWQDRIVACLVQNKRQLSPACSKVFSRRPMAKNATPVRSEGPRAQLDTGSSY